MCILIAKLKRDERHLQMIADGNDSYMQIIASQDDGIFYALKLRN